MPQDQRRFPADVHVVATGDRGHDGRLARRPLGSGPCLSGVTRLAQALKVAPVQEQPAIAAMRPDVIDFGVPLRQRPRTAWTGAERLFAQHASSQPPDRMTPGGQVVQVAVRVVFTTAAAADQLTAAGKRAKA